MNSSFMYQVLLYLSTFYFGMLAILEIFLVFYKGLNLPYPTGSLVSEAIIIIGLIGVEYARLHMAQKGNLTEQVLPIVISLVLTVPSTLGVLYLLLWQSYILRLELILCGIQLCLVGVECFYGVFCIVSFTPYKRF